jgi:hypothetical protein
VTGGRWLGKTIWPDGNKIPSNSGDQGRNSPFGITRLFVHGTKPPAPSGTIGEGGGKKTGKQRTRRQNTYRTLNDTCSAASATMQTSTTAFVCSSKMYGTTFLTNQNAPITSNAALTICLSPKPPLGISYSAMILAPPGTGAPPERRPEARYKGDDQIKDQPSQ